jgi:AraC family transcriptional regulator
MIRWQEVRKHLKSKPIVEGEVGGAAPLYVERYWFTGMERSVPGVDVIAIAAMFGGSRVDAGASEGRRASFLPSQAALAPHDCPTHWRYSGIIDFAVFYFTDPSEGIQQRIAALTHTRSDLIPLGDPLVNTTALQLVSELQKGAGADDSYMALLATVMLEQTYRVLTTPAPGRIDPRLPHFRRLQGVLGFIREHLAEDLSAPVLAAHAQMSVAHFRRLFEQATGAPPHRYVLAARLEQARKLLTMSGLPIARIASDCGFSSQSHLTERFRAAHAATPAEYRANVRRESNG